MIERLKSLLLRQRRPFGRIKFTLESILLVVTTVGLIVAIWNHFESNETATFPGEGKRVVAFRQVTNRICTENRQNMTVALAEADSRVERLAYVARALRWDLNDLESITAPPTRFTGFLEELSTRRQMRSEVVALKRSVEQSDHSGEAVAVGNIRHLEAESRELSREIGVVRCMSAMPKVHELVGAHLD